MIRCQYLVTTMEMNILKTKVNRFDFFVINEEETESRSELSSINLIIKIHLNKITLTCGVYAK